MKRLTDERGMLLALTLMTISVMMVLLASIAPLSIGSYRLTKTMTTDRVRGLNLCQIGYSEAQDMMFNDRTSDLSPAGSFTDPAYDPDPVYMDVDDFSFSSSLQSGSDVKIDIGPDTAGGRTIMTTSINPNE